MRLHAIVEEVETARAAVAGGATVVQLRLKGRSTDEVVERGRALRELPAILVVNDDVDAAIRLGADGVHLGRNDEGAERALESGLLLGLSASTPAEAQATPRRAAPPTWARVRSGKPPRRPMPTLRSGWTGLRAICGGSLRPGRRDRRHRRARTRVPASRRERPGSRSSALRGTRRRYEMRCRALADLGELGLLAELERRGLTTRTENDAAVVEGLVVTTDALVEDVHFRLDWISWRELGFRAAAVNLSDLAASGAEPSALLVSLAASAETRVDDVLELYEGIAETGVPVVGGDTTRADKLRPVGHRPGARRSGCPAAAAPGPATRSS